MILADAGRNAYTDGFRVAFPYLSIHTAFPGATGANEATGGSPAYARKAHALPAAASGQSVSTASVGPFDLPAGTYLFGGYWSASAGGTYGGGFALGNQPMKEAAFATGANTFTLASHGQVNGDTVYLLNVENTALPSGFTEGTLYYVVGATTNTFQLSATLGGAAISGAANASVVFQQVIGRTLGAQSTVAFNAGNLLIDGTPS